MVPHFHRLLDFCYTQRCKIPFQSAPALFYLSDRLQIPRLQVQVTAFVCRDLRHVVISSMDMTSSCKSRLVTYWKAGQELNVTTLLDMVAQSFLQNRCRPFDKGPCNLALNVDLWYRISAGAIQEGRSSSPPLDDEFWCVELVAQCNDTLSHLDHVDDELLDKLKMIFFRMTSEKIVCVIPGEVALTVMELEQTFRRQDTLKSFPQTNTSVQTRCVVWLHV